MSESAYDYIILGQGICGTLLSRQLQKKGKTVLVIDEDRPFTASKVASGIINPVTGRRIVTTWRINELLPFALNEYGIIGKELGINLVNTCSILDFHSTLQMKEAFDSRLQDDTTYLRRNANEDQWKDIFRFNYGIGEILGSLLVDIHTLLSSWRIHLKKSESLLEEKFNWQHCRITNDGVHYKDIKGDRLICCEGVQGFENPYFKNLPYTRMKGEALIVSIPGLPRQNIYKQGLNIVPWQDDLFWVGSTYEWSFNDLSPTPAWRKKAEEQLNYWLKLPFNTLDHLASERPANVERRPFVGLHPQFKSIGIFNGMGAKGCSLAPFFARQLADYLVDEKPLDAAIDVARFEKVLARKIH